jgi:HAD superfamily hydrolase (TIGR01549 family)
MIKAIIFDFDMTLSNSLWQKIFLMWRFCRASNTSFLKLLLHLPGFFGTNFRRLVKDYSHFSIPVARKIYALAFRKTEHLSKFSGKNVLKELRKRKYKTGIVSNELPENIRYSLKKHNVKVTHLISTFCFEKAKPHPMALTKMLRILKVKPSETLYVGDHPNDIKMGRRAKVKTAALVNILHGARRLEKEKPTHLIRNINEVLDIL